MSSSENSAYLSTQCFLSLYRSLKLKSTHNPQRIHCPSPTVLLKVQTSHHHRCPPLALSTSLAEWEKMDFGIKRIWVPNLPLPLLNCALAGHVSPMPPLPRFRTRTRRLPCSPAMTLRTDRTKGLGPRRSHSVAANLKFKVVGSSITKEGGAFI